MNSRARLIQKYEQIIDEEVFNNHEKGIFIPQLCGIVDALKAGKGPEHFDLERAENMQHMDEDWYRKIKWAWERAIRATKKDLEETQQV